MQRKLQVFVSSTYLDLRDERQAAVEGILAAGHIPAGMELFAAGDRSQLDVIRNWIASSDVLLLLLGGRYGTLEPDSGLSYVELEFLHAKQCGIPVCSLILTEEALAAKRAAAQQFVDEHDQEHARFRQSVLRKICEFVSDCKDIKLATVKALNELAQDPKLIGWIRRDQATVDDGLSAEVIRLSQENEILQRRTQAPSDDTHKLVEVLQSLTHPYNRAGSKEPAQLEEVSLDRWLIYAGQALATYPFKIFIHTPQLGKVAPILETLGILTAVADETEFLGRTQKHRYYVFSELGTKVFAELKHRQIKKN